METSCLTYLFILSLLCVTSLETTTPFKTGPERSYPDLLICDALENLTEYYNIKKFVNSYGKRSKHAHLLGAHHFSGIVFVPTDDSLQAKFPFEMTEDDVNYHVSKRHIFPQNSNYTDILCHSEAHTRVINTNLKRKISDGHHHSTNIKYDDFHKIILQNIGANCNGVPDRISWQIIDGEDIPAYPLYPPISCKNGVIVIIDRKLTKPRPLSTVLASAGFAGLSSWQEIVVLLPEVERLQHVTLFIPLDIYKSRSGQESIWAQLIPYYTLTSEIYIEGYYTTGRRFTLTNTHGEFIEFRYPEDGPFRALFDSVPVVARNRLIDNGVVHFLAPMKNSFANNHIDSKAAQTPTNDNKNIPEKDPQSESDETIQAKNTMEHFLSLNNTVSDSIKEIKDTSKNSSLSYFFEGNKFGEFRRSLTDPIYSFWTYIAPLIILFVLYYAAR